MDSILPREFYCMISSSKLSLNQTRIELTGVLELICNGYTTVRGELISQLIPEGLNLIARDIGLCVERGQLIADLHGCQSGGGNVVEFLLFLEQLLKTSQERSERNKHPVLRVEKRARIFLA